MNYDNQTPIFTKNPVSLAVASVLGTHLSFAPIHSSYAQDSGNLIEEIIVTASKRTTSLQDVPLNITAYTANQIETLQLDNILGISKWVPGLTVLEQGNRNGSPIVVRGLNTNAFDEPRGPGGTVGTYIGEIPVYIDLDLNDIERVESLIGPQGTLYGAGTLGGAIRYIPTAVNLDGFEADVYADVLQNAESNGNGWETGFVLNQPILDGTLGIRASYNVEEVPGFIDYSYVLLEPGVSNPQPDFGDSADVSANLRRAEDANGSRISSGRVALRYNPTDLFDATLTYFYQEQKSDGRSIAHYYPEFAESTDFQVGKYESGYRYEEPLTRDDQLLSLEITTDLNFAEFEVALGASESEQLGQRDQTDLLLDFEFGYEFFPGFSAFSRDDSKANNNTAEIRLVSGLEQPFSWIVGYFYNKTEIDFESHEYVPGLPAFNGVDRPDELEFVATRDGEITEQAFFGEIGYQFTDNWQATIGARSYEYDNELTVKTGVPYFLTLIGAIGPTDIPLRGPTNAVDDSGSLFKFNTSYTFSDDVLVYYTLSEGYRVGGINRVPPCPDPLPPGQNACGLPDEIKILPDTTLNSELGLHSTVFGGRLALNAAVFQIDWNDIQIRDRTQNGALRITKNGGEAESKGIELTLRGQLSENWGINAVYSNARAKLTSIAPGLVGGEDGLPGDQLAASPETTAGLGLTYSTQAFNGMDFSVNYNLAYTGDIFSTVGLRNEGERLPAFTVHGVSATLAGERWSGTIYVQNLTDEYAVTGIRQNPTYLRDVNGFDLRWYGRWINTPRNIGMRLTYRFD